MTKCCSDEVEEVKLTVSKLRILHLEFIYSDVLPITNALKIGGIDYENLVVDNKVDFLNALKEFAPDVILANNSVPSFSSIEALALFRETREKIPFIIITPAISDAFAADMIRRGTEDYILQDRLHRLPAAILNSIAKYRVEKEREVFINELVEREKHYCALVENSTDAVAILNALGQVTYVSPSVKTMLGYSEKELMQMDLFTIAHPDDIAGLTNTMEKVLLNPGVPIKGHTGRMLHKDGNWRWLEATVTNMLHDPSVNGIIDNFRDVTDQKLAEKKALSASRLYAFLSQINQVIIHAGDEQTVLKEACRIALETGNFKTAWVGVLDCKNGTVSLVQECGLLPEDLERFTKVYYEEKGPLQNVLNNQTYYVCNDIQQYLAPYKWRQWAAERNYGSVIILPILKQGCITGTFNLFAGEVDFFNSEEIALLVEATANISFALAVFEKEKLRLLADEKLADSELGLKEAMAVAHLGSWDLNFATGIARWSLEQLRIFGLTPQENHQTYDSWLSFAHPDDLSYVLKVTDEARKGLVDCAFFHRIIRRDGSIRHLHCRTRFKLDTEGKATGLHGVVQDVTEMKEVEQAMKESESNLQAIFESTSEGFILADTKGIIKTFNNKSKDRIWLNSGQVINAGTSIFDYVAESRREKYRESIEKVLSGEIWQYDYPYTRTSGEIKWFAFTVNPVYNDDVITGFSITSADITERKRADHSLKESELFNKGILAFLSSHIVVVEKSGDIIEVNKAWDDFAQANGALSSESVSKGSNYFDVCQNSMNDGDVLAQQTLVGIKSVFNKDRTSFELEYPCHSPNEERWFILHVARFGNDDTKVVISHQNITERKKAEDSLGKSEANLQAIFDNTSEGFILTDIGGNIKLFNNQAKEIFLLNSGREIVEGESIFDFVRESMRDEYKNIIPAVLSGKDAQYDVRFDRENGEVKWFIFSITRVITGGLIEGFSISAKDITERKHMDEMIRRSESNLNAVIENTDAFIYSLDRNFNYITFNEALSNMMKDLYGIDIKPGYHVFDFINEFEPEAVQEWNDVYSRGLTGEIVKFEKEFLINDFYSYTSFSIHPIWEDSKVIGLSCFVNDITKEKQAEKAVKQSELRYRQIVETAQEGILLLDKNDKTSFVNQKLCEILGYREDEILGRELHEFMDEDARNTAVYALETKKQALGGKGEFEFISGAGNRVWTSVSSNPVYDDGGAYNGALAMLSDITEKVNANRMLQESELKFRLLASELEIERSRLVEAQAMAKVGSFESDLITSEVRWSQESHRIFETGSTDTHITATAFRAFVHPGDLGRLDGAISDSMRNGFASVEHRIITAKGNEKYVCENWEITKDDNGVPIRAVGTCQDITERKLAEEKTRFQANLLSTIAQAAIATDLNGLISYWNKAAEVIYGWSIQEAIGSNIMQLTPAHQSKEQAMMIMENLKEGRSWSGEFTVQGKDGNCFPVFITNSPVYDHNHELSGILGISSDISEKKKLQNLLDKTNSMARVGSYEADLVNKTLYWSAITREIHEVEVDFVPDFNTAIGLYKTGSSREAIRNAIKEAIDQGVPYDLQVQIVTAKGNERWVRVIGSAECANGKCIKLNGSIQDIDAGKRAEIEVLKVYEEKNIILESIGDGFFAVDKEWVVTYWNKKAEATFGQKREDIVGKNFWHAYPHALNTTIEKHAREAVRENKVRHFEIDYKMLGIWLQVSVYPSPTGLSIYFTNITEQKQLELERKKMTLDIVQRNKDLEQFSYIVSHNLRAPVANIIGLAEELNITTHSADVKQLLKTELLHSVERLDNVITDLNDILQVKRQMGEKNEVVDLTNLIVQITSGIHNLIEKENVQVTTNFSEVGECRTLRTYLHSVFYNLISNSIKYRQPGIKPLIEISSKKLDGKIIITFKDNGTGIDLAKKRDQVFGLYKRFHKGIEGKGIGLFMVKTQVEAMGGTIDIQSAINQGTVFTMSFSL